MKKLFIILVLAAVAHPGLMSAQTKKTGNKPMNQKTDKVSTSSNDKTAIQEYNWNGLKVILKPATNNVVSTQLFITGGVDNYADGMQGVEQLMLLTMADGGSKKYPKEEFHNITERKGIDIGGNAGYDYSTFALRTLATNWQEAMDIYTDVIMNPAWDNQSFELMKNQMISGIQQSEANPDSRIRELAIAGIYKGKGYAKKPEGTVESLSKITLDDLKKHYQSVFKTKRLLLVIVGNVNADELKKKISASLATFDAGSPYQYKNEPVTVTAPALQSEGRTIATNYIVGVMSAPQQGTKEAVALRIAMNILYDQLFVEVRTKRNLSYAPGASVSSLFSPYSSIYVTTTNPDTAVEVMTNVIRKIKKDGFTAQELTNKKAGYLTQYYIAQESNDAQAMTLGVAALIKDWHYALQIKDMVQNLTLKDINSAFDKYASAISWFYLGNESKMTKDIFMKKL